MFGWCKNLTIASQCVASTWTTMSVRRNCGSKFNMSVHADSAMSADVTGCYFQRSHSLSLWHQSVSGGRKWLAKTCPVEHVTSTRLFSKHNRVAWRHVDHSMQGKLSCLRQRSQTQSRDFGMWKIQPSLCYHVYKQCNYCKISGTSSPLPPVWPLKRCQ